MLAANLVPRVWPWAVGARRAAGPAPAGWVVVSQLAQGWAAWSRLLAWHHGQEMLSTPCCRPAHAARPPLGAGQGHPTCPKASSAAASPRTCPSFARHCPCGAGWALAGRTRLWEDHALSFDFSRLSFLLLIRWLMFS